MILKIGTDSWQFKHLCNSRRCKDIGSTDAASKKNSGCVVGASRENNLSIGGDVEPSIGGQRADIEQWRARIDSVGVDDSDCLMLHKQIVIGASPNYIGVVAKPSMRTSCSDGML